MEIRGGLSTYELSTIEKDTFAEYLQHSMNNPALEFIRYLLGDDYIKFIDVMSGTVVKIPSAKSLVRDLESVKIYLYVKRHGFTELSIKEVAKAFGKSTLTAKRYVLKVSKVLGVEDMLEGDDLNNYVVNIKSVEESDYYYTTKVEARQDELRIKKNKIKEAINDQEYGGSDSGDNVEDIEDAEDIEDIEDVEDIEGVEDDECIENDEGSEDIEDTLEDNVQEEIVHNGSIDKYIDKYNNQYGIYLKNCLEGCNNKAIVESDKEGNLYVRVFGDDNTSTIACCYNSRVGIILDLYFKSESDRDSAFEKVHDRFAKIRKWGKKSMTIRRVATPEDLELVLNFVR